MSEVKLIAYTQNENEIFFSTGMDIMAYCARVSNPSNQNNHQTADKLLGYCAKHKHWSVFEMCNVVIEINTTRDIARQILRHRSFHFQEFSQRYADPNELGFETREFRLQDTKNRQNSIDVDEDNETTKSWKMKQDQLIHETKLAYKWAIENGIAKEQARAVLPEGLTMSRMYMNGTVRDWIHYCQLRMGPETQKEHRIIAADCWTILCNIYPFLETLES
jgi:thymidylate synthase (FAD)